MLTFAASNVRFYFLKRCEAELMNRHERIARAIALSGKKKGEIAAACGVANSAVTQ